MPIPAEQSRLDRHLLREDAYRRLRDAIVDGVFAPGEQLRDNMLAEWLGVSRTPVREALLKLGEMGLVIARPGRSTVVSELDAKTVEDARDVVAGMHAVAVSLAIRRLTPADLEEMRATAERFAAAIRAHDVNAALEADAEFHDVPVRVADNRALRSVLDQYLPILRRSEKALFSTVAGDAAIGAHAELIRLCEARDATAAALVSFDSWQTLIEFEVERGPDCGAESALDPG